VSLYQIKKMLASLKSPQAELSVPNLLERPLGAKSRRDSSGLVLETLFVRIAFAERPSLGQLFRHRYVMAHYLGFAGPVFAAFLVIGPGTHRDSEHMPSVMIGVPAMIYTVWLYVRAMQWLSRGKAGQVRILMTPGLLLGVAVQMAVSLSYPISLGVIAHWSTFRLVLLFASLSLYVEFVTAVILRKAVPRAVAELQAKAARAQVLDPTAAPLAAAEMGVDAVETPAVVPAVLEGVLRVEAQGNHVLVVTEQGRHLLPGPFGAFVARLPSNLGRQVHRSHWVACRAIVRTRRQGRDVIIETVDGARVPVASTKFGALRTWLLAATGRMNADETIHKDGGIHDSK
jgi:uncharacterized membrane protein YjfL (UPF0719 family)